MSKQGSAAQKDITKWASDDGQFRRQASSFRDSISEGGRFPPEKGRYYLYVSHACPWANRTMIVRHLKGLTSIIGLAVVHPHMGSEGWSWTVPDEFNNNFPGVIKDPLYGFDKLRQLYFKAQEDYSGRFTVPVLWDSKEETIVNNESSEIIRMFNHEFDSLIEPKYRELDFYPQNLRAQIDSANDWIYPSINNGVYRSGFATKQNAYEEAVVPLFEALDKVEKIFAEDGGRRKYLVGDQLTEADIRLYTTIIRFDPVYVGHFKCNLGTIRFSYPHIHRWVRELYWKNPAFKETTNFEHIKYHYYTSHPQVNPTRIVPKGPLPHILPLDA